MEHTLELAAPPTLDQLESEGLLALFLDFDGTLVELAPTPEGIHVPRALTGSLTMLSQRIGQRLVLVSGRSIEDLSRHLGAPDICWAGSHGVDRIRADGTRIGEAPQTLPAAATRGLEAIASAARGVTLERKCHGAALHYRANPEIGDAVEQQACEIAEQHGLEAKRGKCVVELVLPGTEKGAAVRSFMDAEPFAGSRPVFIGDDLTDEDGFAAAQPLGGFGIHVGPARRTLAQYRLEGPRDVYRWLGMEIE